MVVGEASGDILGSRLIAALKKHYPNAKFEGIAGTEMQQAGCHSFYSMERLSIMGYIEVLPRLLELHKLRKKLIQDWINNPPDLFIGIDAPDFNLKIEKELHKVGIPSVHYVSPSIWAWREWKVKKMVGNLDMMLTLFPFEVDFYKKHKINAHFVGHPLADEIPLNVSRQEARKELALEDDKFILAVLPGSRMAEIKFLATDFIQALKQLHLNHPDWQFVVPLINEKIAKEFNRIKQEIAKDLPITIIKGQSRTVMAASNQILLASGTAVLEGMLIGRPMVATYRVAAITAFIVRFFKIIKVDYFTLPNNLANECLVPELIQEEVTAENIVKEIEKQYAQPLIEKQKILDQFNEIHQTLRQNASQRAAEKLSDLLETEKRK